MTKVIGDYDAAVTIDGNTNYLLIQPGSAATAYKKINRNTLLGVSGQPADISTIQSLTNKTLDNTNTVTLKDTMFTLQDDADVTKQAKFQLSGITTGTTRTYTLPNASSTLADIATAQTFTNKTLTSPVISGGTIDNATITVDTIGGHTSANVVTVAGLSINNGVLNSNNSVVTANITDAAVTPAKLLAGTGSGWSWQSYTPTWTNLIPGNGTVAFSYIQTGKTVVFKGYLLWGNTTSVSGSVSFTLPLTSVAVDGQGRPLGQVKLYFSGTAYQGSLVHLSTTTAVIRWYQVSSTAIIESNISSTSPNTWTTGTEFHFWGMYQAA